MTTFEDGPAKGQTLMLQRAPIFLRVVKGDDGWDALDQLHDSTRKGETLYAYVLTAKPGRYHLYFGGSRGGWYVIATYKVVFPQPVDSIMRDTVAWRDWTELQPIPTLAHQPSETAVRERTGIGEARREADLSEVGSGNAELGATLPQSGIRDPS